MEQYIKANFRILIKIIATILTIIIISQFFPAIVLGIQTNEEQNIPCVTEILTNEEKSTNEETKIIGELLEKRTLNQKHFIQSDGSIIATMYPNNVHYIDDGKFLDIDNSLKEIVENNEELYQNTNNLFHVNFFKNSKENNLVKLNIKNHNINWFLQNSNNVEATLLKTEDIYTENKELTLKNISSGVIKYENILDGIDLEYNVISDFIKENIIIKNKESASNVICFEFDADNLKVYKDEDGRIYFYENGKDDFSFFLEAPFMYDAKNEISDKIEIDLKENNGKYLLTLKPDKNWLEDTNRVYPVTIDPIVETLLDYNYIDDTYIYNGDTGNPNKYLAHILRVGVYDYKPIRSLLKFDLPQLEAGDQVIKAVLDICSYPDTSEWNPPPYQIQIDVHKMTQNWSGPNAYWNNLNSAYNTKVEDYIKYNYDTSNPAKFYYFDITAIVKDWYITGNNYGLVLKAHNESYSTPQRDAYFYSSNVSSAYTNARPMIQIVYRNQTGLENYQTYHVVTVERAGIVHTNDYNGNVILIHDDAITPGNRLPVAINHVYNSNDKDINIGYGRGFRLNLSQTITNEIISGVEYAKYIDEDGTRHYFKKEGNNYIDEDNLGLTLTFENNNYYLEDKDKNKFTFIRKTAGSTYIWHLKEIRDAYQNSIIINLVDDSYFGARISSVSDAVGDTISLTYNGYNLLSTITDVAGRVITYTYNSDKDLTIITYPDNECSRYSYTSNRLLSQVKNFDGTYINLEYYNEKANRVKSIKEYSSQSELGKSLIMSYGNNVTKFIDNTGYSNNYTFNNYGQTISIADFGNDDGNINNAYGKMYEYGEESNNKNKLALESNLISINQLPNNLIVNGNFNNGFNNWDLYLTESCDGVENGAAKLVGNADLDKNIYQTCNISGDFGDIYSYGFWVKTNGIPNNPDEIKRLNVTFFICGTDNIVRHVSKYINVDGNDWQFVWGQFITDAPYQWIRIHLLNNCNANETYFDNVGLFKEENGLSYRYDNSGNIVSTSDYANQESTFSYDSNNNLISAINPRGGSFTYTYDTTNPKKLNYATNNLGNKYSFEYDNYGNITKSKLEHTDNNSKYIENSAQYSSNGNYQTVVTDEREKNTSFEYNQTKGTISKITDANNKVTNFTYDNLDKLTNVSKTVGNTTYSNAYTYENDRIKTITHNGFSYSFIYNNYGRLTRTDLGNQILMTNYFAANNGNLTSQQYGNNQTISYNYDRFNRITKITGTNGNYQYTYDGKSNVKKITDNVNSTTESFTYDLADRLVKSVNSNGFTKEFMYDINNNINSRKYKLNSTTNTVTYNYDNANRVLDVKLNNSITWKNNMDNLSRITSKKITSGSNNYTTTYTYTDVANVTNKTTTFLKSIKNGSNTTINYTYDNLGNIQTIKNGSTLQNKYYYDALNQLVRENSVNQNKTIKYTYDAGGNILSKKEYDYTTASTLPATPNTTITYTYGNSNWKDQLTSYNGNTITYDAIGNPLTYNGNTYTWQNGRQLATIANTSQNLQITYKYNDSGIRTSKTVNGITTNYYLDGAKVIYEKTGDNVIYYTYDENGNILGLKYNNTQYYYIKNGQNDIVGILNSSLAQVVSYEYDSWGNILSIKDANGNNITNPSNIGLINPYRYRSYRYDTETGMYYLQSRYYNPEWGRFINFDNYGGQVGELLSHNGYAYCKNNPINMMDESGNWSILATLTTVVFVAVILYSITTIPVATNTNLLEDVGRVIQDFTEKISTGIKNIVKVKTQVETDVKTETKNKKQESNYWEAELDFDKENVIKGRSISYNEAITRVKMGKSIICKNKSYAAKVAYMFEEVVGPEIDKYQKPGRVYYWHYHINGGHGDPHIWYY